MAQGKMYIPEGIPDLRDLLNSMILGAPKFLDKTGYMPFINLDYRFRQLNEGLICNRMKLGEERYQKLAQMSDQIRVCSKPIPTTRRETPRKGVI
jgi:hypothetical protein